MNHRHFFIRVLPFVLFLSCLPWASAAQYESGKTGSISIHSQLTFASTAEQQKPLPWTDPRHGTFENDIATEAVLPDPLEDLRRALDVMQSTWFEVSVGTWPAGIDWTRAVINTHLVSTVGSLSKALLRPRGQETLHYEAKEIEDDINLYFTQNIAYYFGENAFSIRNQAYDDMLWVVLGWLESIKFIRSHSDRHYRFGPGEPIPGQGRPWHGEQFVQAFAHRARVFWELTRSGWDTKLCEGGMIWNPSLGPYKNAITNELFISGSVGMYLDFPGDNNTSPYMLDGVRQAGHEPVGRFDPKFLKAAVDGYHWLKNVGMTNEKGLYVDGFHVRNWKTNGTKCDIRNEMVYTYNQGVLLSGLRGLWESTGNLSYLEDAHQLARDAIRATGWRLEDHKELDSNRWAGLGRGGILEDRCDARGRCSQNNEMFKGIFMHHLALLCEPLPPTPRSPGNTFGAGKDLMFLHHQSCKQYTPWVAHNAKSALRTRNENGRFGGWWGASDKTEVDPLPDGAPDYRNNVSELLREPWTDLDGIHRSGIRSHQNVEYLLGKEETNSASVENLHVPEQVADELTAKQDMNERGRGRTVETQSGGVAVLRALWELRNLE